MDRITNKQLDSLVQRINTATKSPLQAYTRQNGRPYKANIGHYYIDSAYGGVKLVRIMNENGGINTISQDGYGTKRELFSWMQAFLLGVSEKQST